MFPAQFIKILTDIRNFHAVNLKRISKYDVLLEEVFASGIVSQTYATHTKSKALVSGRLTLDSKYFFPADNLFVISGRDNMALREEYRKNHKSDTSSLEDSLNVLGAFHLNPIFDKDDKSKIIGTDITVVLS